MKRLHDAYLFAGAILLMAVAAFILFLLPPRAATSAPDAIVIDATVDTLDVAQVYLRADSMAEYDVYIFPGLTAGPTGDFTGNGQVTAADIMRLVAYVFRGGESVETIAYPYVTVIVDDSIYLCGDVAVIKVRKEVAP